MAQVVRAAALLGTLEQGSRQPQGRGNTERAGVLQGTGQRYDCTHLWLGAQRLRPEQLLHRPGTDRLHQHGVEPTGEEVLLLIDMEAVLTADEKKELAEADLQAAPQSA